VLLPQLRGHSGPLLPACVLPPGIVALSPKRTKSDPMKQNFGKHLSKTRRIVIVLGLDNLQKFQTAI